jgi:hypothetical protein
MDARTRLDLLDAPFGRPAGAAPDHGCTAARAPAAPRTARLHGLLRFPLTLTPGDLERIGSAPVRGFRGHGTDSARDGASWRLRGVALTRLVEWAEPRFADPGDYRRAAFVAEGHDGYQALFSWQELMDTSVGDGVHVVFDHPEAPLPRDAGPFALVSLHDRHGGPRFVRGLAAVELKLMW